MIAKGDGIIVVPLSLVGDVRHIEARQKGTVIVYNDATWTPDDVEDVIRAAHRHEVSGSVEEVPGA